MSETIEVKLPEGIDACQFRFGNKIRASREKLEAARQAIDEALKRQARQWRDGDVIQLDEMFYLYAPGTHGNTSFPWLTIPDGTRNVRTDDVDRMEPVFRFNLADLLAQGGEIPVMLTEEEASNIHAAFPSYPIEDKVDAALAAYRQRQEGK